MYINHSLRMILSEQIDHLTLVEFSKDYYGMFYVDWCRKVQKRGWIVVDRKMFRCYNDAHMYYIEICNKLETA